VLGYRWEPDGGLYAVDGDRVVGVLETPLRGDEAEQRLALARRLLADAESRRLVRDRPRGMLDALAAGFAAQRLARAPREPLSFTVDEILQWIDGPGLDVILGFVLSRRAQ
jgi:hypothetical protein